LRVPSASAPASNFCCHTKARTCPAATLFSIRTHLVDKTCPRTLPSFGCTEWSVSISPTGEEHRAHCRASGKYASPFHHFKPRDKRFEKQTNTDVFRLSMLSLGTCVGAYGAVLGTIPYAIEGAIKARPVSSPYIKRN
jgi:hypothetical protein